MTWGCIAEGQKGPLVVVEYPGGKGGGMNSESKRYQEQVLGAVFFGFLHSMEAVERLRTIPARWCLLTPK
jgi:hypothetical protein